MRYPAKVDWFLGASLVVGIVVPSLVAILLSLPWMFIASIIAALMVFGLSYPQWHETTGDALVIRSGLTTRVIPYRKITALRHSSDSRSATALSLHRVQIEYGSGDLLIAPRDSQAFFADVEARAPQLSRQGQDLVVSLS